MTRAARWTVAAVACQRIGEVIWSKRNEGRLRRRGGVEVGHRHYPAMVALHVAWLAATAIESSRSPRRTHLAGLVAYAALQPLRYWIIGSLGDRWTTRIIVVPDEEPVVRGPYRRLRHPNYAVVAAEGVLVPLSLGAPRTAFGFTVLNALLMAVRIPTEQQALGSMTQTSAATGTSLQRENEPCSDRDSRRPR